MLIVQEIQIQSIGIESFKDLYKDDEYFSKAYKVCLDFQDYFRTQFSYYILQSRLFFKRNQLCVPQGSMRENLIQEKQNGNLSGHFGINKTMELVQRFTIGPSCQEMSRDMWNNVWCV